MASIDVNIQDILIRYGLPLVIGYLILFYLCGGFWRMLFSAIKLRMITYCMTAYWIKVIKHNKKELDQMFAPLQQLAKEKSTNELTEGEGDLNILEIGVGDGMNFAYYPDFSNVYCLDLQKEHEAKLVSNLEKYPTLKLKEFFVSSAEDMSFVGTGAFDAVICTMCLCSVESPDKVMREVKRVLRKDGIFLYWEHIKNSKNKWIIFMQWFFNEFWMIMFNGCHLTRETWKYIDNAKFSMHEYSKITVPYFALVADTLFGCATK